MKAQRNAPITRSTRQPHSNPLVSSLMTDSSVRAIIVDDERLARRKIRALIKDDPDLQVVGESSNGPDALAAIRDLRPDLVFLDVQMPQMDGFRLLEDLPPAETPLVVFVTAYDQYAVRAFEFSAVDYLLKPVDRTRFTVALRKVKDRLRTEQREAFGARLNALRSHVQTAPAFIDRLPVKTDERVILVRIEEVDWIEAEGKYIKVHSGKSQHPVRESISTIEARLDPRKFLRIHRSFIVNIDRIVELERWFHGEYRVVLKDGTKLMLSRGFKKKLADMLGDLL